MPPRFGQALAVARCAATQGGAVTTRGRGPSGPTPRTGTPPPCVAVHFVMEKRLEFVLVEQVPHVERLGPPAPLGPPEDLVLDLGVELVQHDDVGRVLEVQAVPVVVRVDQEHVQPALAVLAHDARHRAVVALQEAVAQGHAVQHGRDLVERVVERGEQQHFG